MRNTYTLEYPFCGGWMEPAQWQAVLDAVDGGCRLVSFSTLSIPLDGVDERECVEKGIALAEKLSRLVPYTEQAVDVGSSLCWGENRDAWLEFAGKLNRFSAPVSFPAYEIRKNRERLFSSDPQPEGRFSALHKRAVFVWKRLRTMNSGCFPVTWALWFPRAAIRRAACICLPEAGRHSGGQCGPGAAGGILAGAVFPAGGREGGGGADGPE